MYHMSNSGRTNSNSRCEFSIATLVGSQSCELGGIDPHSAQKRHSFRMNEHDAQPTIHRHKKQEVVEIVRVAPISTPI